jgi:hypothetical protein
MNRVKLEALEPETKAEVCLSILHPDGKLTPAAARPIIGLSFPQAELDPLRQPTVKAKAGTLGPDEERLMDSYGRAGALLSILKSKARQVLKRPSRSA